MSSPTLLTNQELADKVEWEGGLTEAFNYFGRDVPVRDRKILKAWAKAYDACSELERLLQEESE